MWRIASLLLFVVLWQGADTTTPIPLGNGDEGETIPNIVLDPDELSIQATLEHLQNEHDQMKQDMQQSQAQILTQIQGLQEENSLLRKQQGDYQAMISTMISDIGKQMAQSLQHLGQQVQDQVSELVSSVGEVRGQQEAVMQQVGLMQSVLDVVQEFEDEAHNITAHLAHIQDRLETVEANVLQLEMDSSNYAVQQSAAQERMNGLEAMLQKLLGGQGSQAPSSTRFTIPTTVPTTSSRLPSTETTSTRRPWTHPPTSTSFSTERTSTWRPRTSPPTSTSFSTERTSTWRPRTSPSTTSSFTTERPTTWQPRTSPPSSTPFTSERTSTWRPRTSPPTSTSFSTERTTTREPSESYPTSSPLSTTVLPLEFTISVGYDNSLVTSLLVTSGGKLLAGDFSNNKVMMFSMTNPGEEEDYYSLDKPWALLELEDGTIAVTMEYQYEIVILRINDNRLELVRRINTNLTYFGITQGPDDTLIVSNRKTDSEVSTIDVISMNGTKLRTILQDVDFLVHPFCIRRFGDDVYVSDWTSQKFFRVNINTGEAKFDIGGLDLSGLDFEQPRKFDVDSHGNLYIATKGSVCHPGHDFCIVQVTQSGTWKMMESYRPQNDGVFPYGVDVTSSMIIISWAIWDELWSSEVTAYSLPQISSTPGGVEAETTHSTPSGVDSESTTHHKMCAHKLGTTESGEGQSGVSETLTTLPPSRASESSPVSFTHPSTHTQSAESTHPSSSPLQNTETTPVNPPPSSSAQSSSAASTINMREHSTVNIPSSSHPSLESTTVHTPPMSTPGNSPVFSPSSSQRPESTPQNTPPSSPRSQSTPPSLPPSTPRSTPPSSPQPESTPRSTPPSSPPPESTPQSTPPSSPPPESTPQSTPPSSPPPESTPQSTPPSSPPPESTPQSTPPSSPPRSTSPSSPQPDCITQSTLPSSPKPESTPRSTPPSSLPLESTPRSTPPSSPPLESTPRSIPPSSLPPESTPRSTPPSSPPLESTPRSTPPSSPPLESTPRSTPPSSPPLESTPRNTPPSSPPLESTPRSTPPPPQPESTPQSIRPSSPQPGSTPRNTPPSPAQSTPRSTAPSSPPPGLQSTLKGTPPSTMPQATTTKKAPESTQNVVTDVYEYMYEYGLQP